MRSLLDLPDEYVRPEWKTCAVPGRPWWRVERHFTHDGSLQGEPTAETVDLCRVGAERCTFSVSAPGAPWPWEEIHRVATQTDEANPLPHPGYRVGQVWASMNTTRKTWTVAQITVHHSTGMLINAPARGETTVLYLLHDPIRPDLAPWSSAL